MISELHPLEPFLPVGARLLMLGSFPPQRVRWSMDFFYPNLQNDMWRIVGLVFFGDKGYFLTPDAKRFDKERIVRFCEEKGLALYDTAEEIIRLKNNASDNFLQVVREVDLAQLLAAVPTCRAIVTTGQKATDVIVRLAGCAEPPVGESVGVRLCGPYASALSYALFVAGLSETGGVEGGLLPADVRCVRDALIELPVG